MELILPADLLEHVKDALALLKCDLHGLQQPAVLRHQFGLLLVAQLHVLQNRRAGDGDRTGVLRIADRHVLRFDGLRLALRNGVGQVLILTLLSFGLAVAVSRRAAAEEQKRQKERSQSVKLLHCITSVMS